MECLFCKIIKGEIPLYKVYEDDKVLAFLDIAPVNKGHILVIPKEHTENLMTMSPEQIIEVFRVVQKLTKSLESILQPDGINIGMNNKEGSGQVIFHAHVHIMPRYNNDGLRLWSPGYKYKDDEATKLAGEIKNKSF